MPQDIYSKAGADAAFVADSPEGRQALAESTELSAAFVRFVDQNGDPLPPGSLTTIHVNTVTGDIDDITFQEA